MTDYKKFKLHGSVRVQKTCSRLIWFLINYCVYLTRGSSLHLDAIFDDYFSKNPTNNGVLIKYLPRHSDSKQNIYQISTANKSFPISLLSSSSSRISQLCLPIHIKTKSTRVLFPHKSMCSRF